MPASRPWSKRALTTAVAAATATTGIALVAAAPPASAETTFTFAPQTASSTGVFPRSVGMGDLDGDGLTDLVSTASWFDSSTVTVATAQAGGGYVTSTHSVGNAPQNLKVVDLDHDGDDDVVTANWFGGNVTILTQSGGGLTATNVPVPGAGPFGLAVGDADADGDLDIAVTNNSPQGSGPGPTAFLLTRGSDGSYTSTLVGSTGATPGDLVMANLDADPEKEIVTANENGAGNAGSLTIFDRQSGGSYTSQEFTLNSKPYAITTGDLDGDGVDELATASRQSADIKVVDRQSGGAWTVTATATNPSQGDTFVDIVPADLDGDGIPELVTANAPANKAVSVFQRGTDGSYSHRGFVPTGTSLGGNSQGQAIEARDADGDGDLDLVVSIGAIQSSTGEAIVLRNDTTQVGGPSDTTAPTTTDNVPTSPVAASQVPFPVTLSAADNAGGSGVAAIRYEIGSASAPAADPGAGSPTYTESEKPQLQAGQYIRYSAVDVAGNSETPKTSATLQVEDPPPGLDFDPTTVSGLGQPRAFTRADLDGDGVPEIVVVNDARNVVVLDRGNDGAYTPTIVGTTGAQPNDVIAADLDGDGDVDIATADFQGNTVTILTRGTAGDYTAANVATGGSNPSAIRAADMDGDGDPELVVANAGSNNVAILTLTGTTWSTATAGTTGFLPIWLEVADLDGDGDRDIATADIRQNEVGPNNVTVLTNDGASGFARVAVNGGGQSPRSIAAADLDNDGTRELLVSNYASNDVTVLTRGAGGAYAVTDTLSIAGGHPTEVAAADVDGDSDIDLFVTSEAGDALHVFRRTPSGGYEGPETFASPAFTQAVEIADLDGDTDLDFATLNYGTGTVIVFTNGTVSTPADTVAPTTTDDVPTDLHVGMVRVTLTATDNVDGSGVDEIRYTIGSAANPPADPRTAGLVYDSNDKPTLLDGQVIRYSAVDNAGNVEEPETSAAAQVTTGVDDLFVDGTPAVGETLTHRVRLTPADAAVTYQWRRYDADATGPNSPFTVIDGATGPTYTVTAADVGHIVAITVTASAPGHRNRTGIAFSDGVVANPDQTAPVTTDDVPAGFVDAPVAVTLAATDEQGGSGVKEIRYTVGSAPADPRTSGQVYDPSSKPLLSNGQRIRYSAVDNAGNVEEPKLSGEARIDTVAPVTTDNVDPNPRTAPTLVELTATDNGGSGVASIRYSIGTAANPPVDPRGSGGTVYNGANKPLLRHGELIRYAAIDNLGNTEAPHNSIAAQVDAIVTKPTISGTARVGSKLTASATSPTPGAVVGYRWFRAGTPIPGAVGATYTVINADAGKQLTVVAYAGAEGYRTASNTSDPVTVAQPVVPPNYTVTATGGTRVGTVRVAETSLDDDNTIDLTYQWQRANNTGGWVDLPGAAAKQRRYELPPAVMNLNTRVEVTAVRGTSRVVKGGGVLRILPGNHNASDPRITGKLEVGEKVTAVYDDAVEPDDLKVTYNWTIGGNEIRATGKTITLPKGSAGKKIICDIRLTAPGYHNQEFRTPAKTIKP